MYVFESFGKLHFRPTFDAGPVRRCIAIVRAIQADCLAKIRTTETKPTGPTYPTEPYHSTVYGVYENRKT